jgi:hypothetical protein
MEYFVDKESIVRQIWGKGDTILFIFAGASGEFALNKAVDWLYFTGRLPADPLGRLFSTVSYARNIVFATNDEALKTIDRITKIHEGVEKARGSAIPDWAYRDVLFMLIHYSISAYELLEKKLSPQEKEDVYQVFYRMGLRMGLKELPADYPSWLISRDQHLKQDLQKSGYTVDLYRQYRKHLGALRFWLLKEGQALVCPPLVVRLLGFKERSLLTPILAAYKISRKLRMDWFLKSLVLPAEYKKQIRDLDTVKL